MLKSIIIPIKNYRFPSTMIACKLINTSDKTFENFRIATTSSKGDEFLFGIALNFEMLEKSTNEQIEKFTKKFEDFDIYLEPENLTSKIFVNDIVYENYSKGCDCGTSPHIEIGKEFTLSPKQEIIIFVRNEHFYNNSIGISLLFNKKD